MIIETTHLQTLVAIAKAQSFSKAAEELHVTQSAISQNIKNLELKLGVKLLTRNGKKVLLTEEGQKLFLISREFLNKIDKTIHELIEDKDLMRGEIKVGTLVGIGKSWLSNRIIDFSSLNPDIKLTAMYHNTDQLLDEFENNELDCIIVSEDHCPAIGEKIQIFDEQLTLVYPDTKEFNFLANTKLTLEMLNNLPSIMFDNGDPLFFRWCKEIFGSIPKKINKRIVVNSHGTIMAAVHRGLGIAVLPTHVLYRSFYKDKVKTLGSKYEVFHNRYYFIAHKEVIPLRRIQSFINFLTQDRVS